MIQENPEHSDLTKLGEGGTHPNRNLETFPQPKPGTRLCGGTADFRVYLYLPQDRTA